MDLKQLQDEIRRIEEAEEKLASNMPSLEDLNQTLQEAFNRVASAILSQRYELKVGDRLKFKRDALVWNAGELFEILRDGGDVWLLATPTQGRVTEISKVDIWNWFDLWPGQDPPAIEKKECEHKFVNVSFMTIKMECKHCGIPEEQHKATKNAGKYEHDGC